MRIYLNITIFLLIHSALYSFENNLSAESNSAVKILFVGNSFTGWHNMPEMFKELSQKNSKDIYIDNVIEYGRSLYELSQLELLKNKINSLNWDYIIVQDSPYRIAYPDEFNETNRLLPALNTIKFNAKQHYKGTEIIFFMPWAYQDGKFWVNEGFEDYFQMQASIRTNSIELAKDLEMKIAPVGWAWYNLLAEGNGIELFEPDFTHPTLEGAYLNACVIYTSIFQENLRSQEYTADFLPHVALYFQRVASNTVLDGLEDWNIITEVEIIKSELFQLYQNYPNPFNSQTRISFTLTEKEFINLEIFNNIGQKVETLTNSFYTKGIHHIDFTAENLPSGIYYYRLNMKTRSITKAMILLK